VLALRANDGRDCSTKLTDLNPPAAGPGIWQPNPPPVLGQPNPPVLGLCLPGMRPLALHSASQFRPGPPNNLRSRKYADDFNQVKELGAIDSTKRTSEQTTQAQFWTDHDLRQWNDGLLRLAAAQGLDLVPRLQGHGSRPRKIIPQTSGAQMARPTKDTPPKLPKSSKAASAAGLAKGRGGAAGAGYAMVEATSRATSKRPKRRRPTTR
jgi:hypothetical protein